VSKAEAKCEHHSDDDHARHSPNLSGKGAGGASGDHAGHSHGPTRSKSRSRLTAVLGLTAVLMLAELLAGIYSHSLALMADAGHLLTDVASQALALLAIWFSSKPPTPGKSYGYYRTEILASLINGVVLVGISLFILYEALHRLSSPPAVQAPLMLIVASVGLAVNLLSMRLLHSVAEHSLNVKAAYLELLGDLLASGGVVIAALVITFTHWYIADPLISVMIGVLILPRTWMLLAESTNILMEGTPSHIDVEALHGKLLGVSGVLDVHDIHVWTITSGLDAMSGHVCVARGEAPERVLSDVTRIAQHDFQIQHTTIQVEIVDRE
jgi:cobalt-zinc-cadmium efflux system protein